MTDQERIGSYLISEEVGQSRSSVVYRGRKDSDERSYIIKVLKTRIPAPSEIARFRYEYELIKKIDIPGVIKTCDFVEYEDRIALVLEDFDGVSLKDILAAKKLDMKSFLQIARKIVNTMGRLHEKNIIHRDIKPHNILVNPARGKVKITDFGISTLITHESDEIFDPDIVQGTLVYMSPEQTGRMNREVDYRSDIYSLGVTFYEMLTGSVPFKSKDPMEVIHSHLARQPTPPSTISFSIAPVLSDMVMKMLAKTPEDRYQNCYGILADLNSCYEQLKEKGTIDHFEIADRDISLKFTIPQMLVGRDSELEIIMDSYKRASDGSKELFLVSGGTGIGKSSLAMEMQHHVTGEGGFFLTGTYDRFRRDVPYSAIVQSFQGLISQLLSSGEDSVIRWKSMLADALGNSGKIITDIIPMLELIIGKQPDLPDLGPEEAQNRFNHVFKNFIGIFADSKHPVVLFLDDLHLADSASFVLLETLLADPDLNFIMVIGTYRDSEISSGHMLARLQEDLEKSGTSVHDIDLQNLDYDDVNEIVAGFLRSGGEMSRPLADQVYRKTRGNPFFVIQFIKTLYEENILSLDPQKGWMWDSESVEKMQVTENVVEHLSRKIATLPEGTLNIIKLCACVGNRFDLETMAAISMKGLDEILEDVNKAISEGLVRHTSRGYRFQHDRIREAAYSLIPEEEKVSMHYMIGRYVLNNTDTNDMDDKVLFVVDHLNAGSSIIDSEDERYKLAELNVRAAEKTKASAAYRSSLSYYAFALELLNSSYWEGHYDFMFSLCRETAQAAYLSGDIELMAGYLDVSMKNARNDMDRVKIYEIEMLAYIARDMHEDVIVAARKALKLLGYSLPNNPSILRVGLAILKTQVNLFGKKIESFARARDIENEKILTVLRILPTIGSTAFYISPNLYGYIILMAINISIKHGSSSYSTIIWAGYGALLCGILKKFDTGYSIGTLALELLNRYDDKRSRCFILFIVNTFIFHWKVHVKDTSPKLFDAYNYGLESGEYIFASHSVHTHCFAEYMMGTNLLEVEEKFRVYGDIILNRLKHRANHDQHRSYHQAILNLLDRSSDVTRLVGEAYNENESLDELIEAHEVINIFNVYFNKLVLNYLFHDYSSAVLNADNAEKYIEGVVSVYVTPVFYYYDSLARLALYETAGRRQRKKLLKKVKSNQKKMKNWSDNAPMNHLHRYLLVEAELCRISGNDSRALELYGKAAEAAKENGFIQDEAIAYERSAIFWLKKENIDFGALQMTRAYQCYARWGAAAKTRDIKERHPRLISKALYSPSSVDSDTETLGGTTSLGKMSIQNLDINTIMKTSQAISSEIDPGKLLGIIMKLSIENAGARKGFLIFEDSLEKGLRIEAAGSVEGGITVQQSEPLEESEKLARSIVNYVHKTLENVVINDAREDERFSDDAFIKMNQARSILCAPVMHKGKAAGILYLENDLTANAFTPDRLELMRIFSTQAAISIENSRLLAQRENAAKLETEMKIAANIQTALLPENPQIDGYEIAAYMEPADDVGGDYYDIINTGVNDWVIIGDVSGHGVPAGLVMMMVQTSIQAVVGEYPGVLPSDLLRIVNRAISTNVKRMGEDKYMTITALVLGKDGKIIFSGLHQDILVYRSQTGAVDEVRSAGIWLSPWDIGQVGDVDLPVDLEGGDVMLLYTDGITEAADEKGVMFGNSLLVDIFKKSGGGSCDDIRNAILEGLQDYHINDDKTFVVVKKLS